MKGKTWKQKISLGELIAALFEETEKISKDSVERKLLVYLALNDLLRGGVVPQS